MNIKKSTLMTVLGTVGLGLLKSKTGNRNINEIPDFDVVLHHYSTSRYGDHPERERVLKYLANEDSFYLLKQYGSFLKIQKSICVDQNFDFKSDVLTPLLKKNEDRRYFSETHWVSDIKDDIDFREVLEDQGYEWLFREDFEDEWDYQFWLEDIKSLDDEDQREEIELKFDITEQDRDCYDLDLAWDFDIDDWIFGELSEKDEFAEQLATEIMCSRLAMDILSFNFDLIVSGDAFAAEFTNKGKVSEIINYLDSDDFEMGDGTDTIRFLNDAPVFQLFLSVINDLEEINVLCLKEKLKSKITSIEIISNRWGSLESYDFNFSFDDFSFVTSYRVGRHTLEEFSLLGMSCIIYAKAKNKSFVPLIRSGLKSVAQGLLMNPRYWSESKGRIRSF
jgi:hypothetical protein